MILWNALGVGIPWSPLLCWYLYSQTRTLVSGVWRVWHKTYLPFAILICNWSLGTESMRHFFKDLNNFIRKSKVGLFFLVVHIKRKIILQSWNKSTGCCQACWWLVLNKTWNCIFSTTNYDVEKKEKSYAHLLIEK